MWYGSSVQCKTSQQHAVSVCPREEGLKDQKKKKNSVKASFTKMEKTGKCIVRHLKHLQILHTQKITATRACMWWWREKKRSIPLFSAQVGCQSVWTSCSSSSRTAVHTVPLLKDSLSFEPGSTWTLPVLPPALWSHEIRENDADYLTNKEDTGRRLIMRSSGSIPEENNQRAGRTRRIRTDLWQAALHLDNLFRSAEEKYDLNFADFIMQ